MLRFEDDIDSVFDAIVRASIEAAIEDVEFIIGSHADANAAVQDFKDTYPEAGKVYTPQTTLKVLQNMLECHNRPETYFLNDYHYLLLYDVLSVFCDVHNDLVSEAKGKRKKQLSQVGEFFIEKIDFGDIIDSNFWDTDFLTNQKVILGLGVEGRKEMGMNDETFSIANCMVPHPEELELRLFTGDDQTKKSQELELFGPKSKQYPDWNYYARNHGERGLPDD